MSATRVLLVDDSREDRYLLMQACKEVGFKHGIDVASDGQEALDYLLGKDGEPPKAAPCLAILDLKMPGVSGLEVLRAVHKHERFRHLVFVVLSSSDEQRDRADAAALGANIYFTKPLDYDGYIALAKRISGLLEHAR
jgi:two-component system response regulator